MIFPAVFAAVGKFIAAAGAAYGAAVNSVALIAHAASFKTLSIATSVAIGKAVVGGVIAYGLYQLGKPPPPQYSYLSGRKHFQVRPNPKRVVVYGRCWLAGAVISQCSRVNDNGWGYLYLIAAIADHKLKKLWNMKIFDQEFFTQTEKEDWQMKGGLPRGTGGEALSVWRKAAIQSANRDAAVSTNYGFDFVYGFRGEEIQHRLEGKDNDGEDLTPAGDYYSMPGFRGGTGEGAPTDRFNMKAVGASWVAFRLSRTPKDKPNYWNQIPNFSFEVERGNENLDVRFLFSKLDIGPQAKVVGKTPNAATKNLWAAGVTQLGSSSIDLSPEETDETLYSNPITVNNKTYKNNAELKTAIYEDLVANYYAEGNAALCTADFLKRYTAYGQKICGDYRIDRDSVLAAAECCERYIDAGGNNTPLTANGAMPIERPDAVLQQLTMAMNSGAIVESGGIRYVHAGSGSKDVVTKCTYKDEHIEMDRNTGDPEMRFSRTSNISKRTSLLNVHYLDEEGVQQVTGVRAVSFDGRKLKRTTISGMELNFINNKSQAEQVARIAMDRQWNSAAVEFVCLDTSKVPRPYDIIEVDTDNLQEFAQRKFRVTGISNELDGAVRVQAVWEDKNLYVATEASGYVELPLPDPDATEENFFVWDDYENKADSQVENFDLPPGTKIITKIQVDAANNLRIN